MPPPPVQIQTFGKRHSPRFVDARAVEPIPVDHAAFFEAVRKDLADQVEPHASVVPRSFKAAFLAGLVVGCGLAGFDVTGGDGAAKVAAIAGMLHVRVDTTSILPALIAIGLFGGARAAAMTMIVVHAVLQQAGRTDHLAYAIGGAAATAALAGLLTAFGHPPTCGWPVELAAGAATGLLYRIFAGRRPVESRPR